MIDHCVGMLEGNDGSLAEIIKEPSPKRTPLTECIESENVPTGCTFVASGSAEAGVSSVETHAASGDTTTKSDSPLPESATSGQGSTSKVLLPAGNDLEVINRPKNQALGSRKRIAKQSAKAGDHDISTEGTWKVSSRKEDDSEKNVVRIRRQNLTDIPRTNQELAVSSGLESAEFRSQLLSEATDSTEGRYLSGEADGATLKQSATSPRELDAGTANAATVVTKADAEARTDGDVAASRSEFARPKRQRKVRIKNEGSRKSQRCISRRQNGAECTTNVPTSTAEVKTANSSAETQKVSDDNVSCLPFSNLGVSQEQVTPAEKSADNTRTGPETSISGSDTLQTETDLQTSCRNIVTTSDNDVIVPLISTVSSNNSDLEPEMDVKSHSGEFPDKVDITDTVLSASHVYISCHDNVHDVSSSLVTPEVKTELSLGAASTLTYAENDAIKVETNHPDCSLSALAFDLSGSLPGDALLPNTCLSGTVIEPSLTPEKHPSHRSILNSPAMDRTDQQHLSAHETADCVDSSVAVMNDECESENICKTILNEAVGNVAKENRSTPSKIKDEQYEKSAEIVRASELLSADSTRCDTGSSTLENETESTAGEIPLKKRRGHRVFANCQPNTTSGVSDNGAGDRHTTWGPKHCRKAPSSSLHRHSPRGNKYVGAHTSVIGKAFPLIFNKSFHFIIFFLLFFVLKVLILLHLWTVVMFFGFFVVGIV